AHLAILGTRAERAGRRARGSSRSGAGPPAATPPRPRPGGRPRQPRQAGRPPPPPRGDALRPGAGRGGPPPREPVAGADRPARRVARYDRDRPGEAGGDPAAARLPSAGRPDRGCRRDNRGAGNGLLPHRASAVPLLRGDGLGPAGRAGGARRPPPAGGRRRGDRPGRDAARPPRRLGRSPRRERDRVRHEPARPGGRRRAATAAGAPAADPRRPGRTLPNLRRVAGVGRHLRDVRHPRLPDPAPQRRGRPPCDRAGSGGGGPPQVGRAPPGRAPPDGRHRGRDRQDRERI
ncbi:MAG: hypothetical protein AVDCRST_MAG59-5023, partial [uncultured Thermomicrobiales bacterium]